MTTVVLVSRRRAVFVSVVAVAAAAALGGCSASPANKASSTRTTSSTAAPTSSTSSAGAGTSTAPSSTTAGVQNLPVTADVRIQLVAAGAALNKLPPSAYTGLVTGTTYYAYDPATSTYWAGAGLVPSPSSYPAQVATQDDGSYLLYSQPTGGTWTAVPDGLGGIGGTPCPAVPAAVVAAWGWTAGTCRPPSRPAA